MISFINTTINKPCILKGGPYDGQIDTIACLMPDSPCDFKKFMSPISKGIITYITRMDSSTKWSKDEDGRYILDYVDKVSQNEL